MSDDTDYTFSYLYERNKFFRLDVIMIYLLVPAYGYYFQFRVFDAEDLVANFSLIGVCSFLLVMFFMPYWSNVAMSVMHYSSVSDVEDATHVYVTAYHKKQNTKSTGIVMISYVEDSYLKSGETNFFIEFREKFVFTFDKHGDGQFERLKYKENENFGFYLKQEGLNKKRDIEVIENTYGQNDLEVPLPQFQELLKEHMVAPFFVFQIFCTLLWLMDEYWYYAIFTLFLLMFAESTVVFQRKKNMERLRAMRIYPYAIPVLRNGEWINVQTDMLLPGDVCLVRRLKQPKKEESKDGKKGEKEQKNYIPCDILVL